MADTTKLEPKEATRGFLTVVIGEETLSGQRTSAGTVLDACDGLAGKVAADYCGNRVATISFASVYISGPILHADLVRMEGSVIRVGSSSMLVEVRVYKVSFPPPISNHHFIIHCHDHYHHHHQHHASRRLTSDDDGGNG